MLDRQFGRNLLVSREQKRREMEEGERGQENEVTLSENIGLDRKTNSMKKYEKISF